MHDFTSLHPAFGTDSPMWRSLREYGEPEPDCIDFGVAEMKFRLAPEIAEGIERQLREGSFGYSGAPESLKREIKDWMRRRHGWEIDTEWLNQTYGLVLGVGCCIRALTQPATPCSCTSRAIRHSTGQSSRTAAASCAPTSSRRSAVGRWTSRTWSAR